MNANNGMVTPLDPIHTQAQAEAIARKALALAEGKDMVVSVIKTYNRSTDFAGNEISTQRDAFLGNISITVRDETRSASSGTQRTDDEGIADAVAEAKRSLALAASAARAARGGGAAAAASPPLLTPRSYTQPQGLWYDSTGAVEIDERVKAAVAAINRSRGFIAAGVVEVVSQSILVMNSRGLTAYSRDCRGNVTVSARTQDNSASGWAGQRVYDIGNLQPAETAARAVDKAARMRNPSAVEPGRWTVILEPAAYAPMIQALANAHLQLAPSNNGLTVFSDGNGGNRIGQKVFDERISWISDPLDVDGPYRPFDTRGAPYERTLWIENGILRELAYNDVEGLRRGREFGLAATGAQVVGVRIQPAAGVKLMTLEEMVATCEKGIYVSRLTAAGTGARLGGARAGGRGGGVPAGTFSGVTRDGTWLVEKGKITRPIKNMRFLDSPMFFLNNIEAIGAPVLVPSPPPIPIVLPPLRVRDFSFTALADAI